MSSREGKIGKRSKPKKRKNKINLVFDDAKRRDFLSGFHKRKVMRQHKAQEELNEMLKVEKKRIKQEAKESYKKLVVSYRPIPELADLFNQEYETEDATVKITELSANDLSERNNWIGQNRPHYSDDDEKESSEESEEEELPGMEPIAKKVKKKVEEKEEIPVKTFKSQKEVKKLVKKEATKNVKKSKAFQKKNALETKKNRKKSQQQKHRRLKFADKNSKMKNKNNKLNKVSKSKSKTKNRER